MNILVISQYYYPEPFRVSDICENLALRGHKVTVLTGLPNYPEGEILYEYRKRKNRNQIINNVDIRRVYQVARGKNRFSLFLNYISFAFFASIKAVLIKEEFDVVFVNQLSPILMGIPAVIYKWKKKKKFLLYCLDLWPESLTAGNIGKDSIIYKLFLFISKRIYKSADKIVVSSNSFKQYFHDTLKISSIDLEYIPQYAEDVFAHHNNLWFKNSEDRSVNLVFAGNVGKLQSVETIILAAHQLKDSQLIIHIVGDGSNLENCKNMADKLNVSNVIFHGRKSVEEVTLFYATADALLITLINNETISYTLPGKMQSYMAIGKPIIGAVNGEAKEIIEESDCGLCCEAENYLSLANIILEFINSSEKKKMGDNAREYYMKYFDKEIFFSQMEEQLMRLVHSN